MPGTGGAGAFDEGAAAELAPPLEPAAPEADPPPPGRIVVELPAGPAWLFWAPGLGIAARVLLVAPGPAVTVVAGPPDDPAVGLPGVPFPEPHAARITAAAKVTAADRFVNMVRFVDMVLFVAEGDGRLDA